MKKSIVRRPVLAPLASIGIDLAGESAVLCMVDREGSVVQLEAIVLTREVVRSVCSGERHVVLLEACNNSAWVARELEELGHDVVVCNPRRLKLIAQSTLKTDKLDAETLGRLARIHQLDPKLVQGSVVRTRTTQLHRSALGARDLLVKQRSGCVVTIRSILRADALPRTKGDATSFARNVRKMDLPDDILFLITPLLDTLDALAKQIAEYDAQLQAVAASIPVVPRWQEISGVGALTAVALALTIEDPRRFERARDVGPYLGFTPVIRQSGPTEIRGRCPKSGDSRTRRFLIQAAHCLINSKRDCALKRWALAVQARSGKKKARVALARKLAVVMQRMWLTGEAYVAFPDKEVASAA